MSDCDQCKVPSTRGLCLSDAKGSITLKEPQYKYVLLACGANSIYNSQSTKRLWSHAQHRPKSVARQAD